MKCNKIHITKTAPVAVVSLFPNTAAVPLGDDFWADLKEAGENLAQDNTLKAIILEFNFPSKVADFNYPYAAQTAINVLTTLNTWEHLGKATIAVVKGTISNALFPLLLMCDLSVSTEASSFMLIPAISDRILCYYLKQYISVGNLRKILLIENFLSATKAKEYGLLSAVVAEDKLSSTVAAWVEQILTHNAVKIQQAKQMIHEVYGTNIEEHFSLNNILPLWFV